MKSIRSIITILTVIIFIGLPLSGCDDKSQPNNTTQTSNTAKQRDINKEVKDSLENFNVKIEAISKEFKDAIGDISTMKAKLQEKELWLWGAIGLSTVALILCVICLRLCANLQRRASRQRNDIQELQQERQVNSFTPKTVTKSSIPSDYESLKRRILDLETQVRQYNSYTRPLQQSSTIITSPVTEVEPNKNGYFGNPIQATEPYFKKLIVSRDSEARFSVEISGNKAIFKPLESSSYLGTFVSNDAMRAAIDFVGCAPTEASSMRVILPGEALQRDNRWFITKKAQILLSR